MAYVVQRLSRFSTACALPSPPLPARFRARTQQTNSLCDRRRLPRRLIAQGRCTGGLTSQLIHCCTPRRLPCSIQTITTRGYSLLLTVTGAPLLGRQLIYDVMPQNYGKSMRAGLQRFLDVSRGSHLPFRVLQQPRYALTGSIRPSSLGSPSSWQSRALRRAARTKDAALHLFSKCIVRRARLRPRPRPGAQPHCAPIVCDRG